ncbi:RETICULON [Salix viminalis]|uniref:Reticulon-like protein n=1 Tax=Salix viminalis TaxID=40686 RepID=A0A9Q0NJV8_SALVM|nr:RETICULON [Salix viminalis]
MGRLQVDPRPILLSCTLDVSGEVEELALATLATSTPAPRISGHQALGGGPVADELLWKRWYASIGVLVSATTLWILFERAGYNLSSFVANVLFLLVFILFFWAKSASLLNRPLPPLQKLEIPEEIAAKAAGVIHVYANHALSIAREIVIDKNLKVFLQHLISVVSATSSLLSTLRFFSFSQFL